MLRRQFLSYVSAAALLPRAGHAAGKGAFDFTFPDIDSGVVDLAAWAGRPFMVVNTASKCGFTYQYDGLQVLYDRFRGDGFVILNVPSDDFGGQELNSEAEVKEFCEVNFSLDMPMTAITKVKGKNRHRFYDWAQRTAGASGTPRWNFHKILIGHDGQILDGSPSQVVPEHPRIIRAVEAALIAAGPATG
ncbi:MAG: glutathione peroxidase [Pseudomonadota bacterium]